MLSAAVTPEESINLSIGYYIQPQETSSAKLLKRLGNPQHLLYIVPFINAGVEAIQTSFGLQGRAPALNYITAPLAFASGMGIGIRFTVKGMKATGQLIRTRKIPEDWHKLSPTREKIAIATAGSIILWVAFSDLIQSWFFIQQAPKEYKFEDQVNQTIWLVPTVIVAGTAGVSVIFSEGFETYKGIRELLSSKSYRYVNTFSRYASQIAMMTSGYFGAMNDILISYVGIRAVLGVTDTPVVVLLAGLSLLNGLTDFALNGPFVRYSVNKTIEHITTKSMTALEILSFITMIGCSILLSYAGEGYLEQMWKIALEDLQIVGSEMASVLAVFMTWGGFYYYFMTYSPSFYTQAYFLLEKMAQAGACIYSSLPSCKSPEEQPLLTKPLNEVVVEEPKEKIQEEKIIILDEPEEILAESIPAVPSIANRNTLFALPSPVAQQEPKPAKRCGCNIL